MFPCFNDSVFSARYIMQYRPCFVTHRCPCWWYTMVCEWRRSCVKRYGYRYIYIYIYIYPTTLINNKLHLDVPEFFLSVRRLNNSASLQCWMLATGVKTLVQLTFDIRVDNEQGFISVCPVQWHLLKFVIFKERWYMIYLLTAIGLTPGGSSTLHIYT